MNRNDIKSLGGIVSAKPVKQAIEWTYTDDNGEEQTYTGFIFVKILAYGDYEKLFLNLSTVPAEEEGETRSRQAELMAFAIRLGDDGKEQLSYEDAYQLQPNLAAAFIDAINKVNGKHKKKANANPGVLARNGDKQHRGKHHKGSQIEPDFSGNPGLDGVLPATGNPEPQPQA